MRAHMGAAVPNAARRPQARRRRAIGPAIGVLIAPAIAMVGLVAFGAMKGGSEAGLGSLPASAGLQGAAVAPTATPADTDATDKPDKDFDRYANDSSESGRGRNRRTVAAPPDPCAKPSRASAASQCGEDGTSDWVRRPSPAPSSPPVQIPSNQPGGIGGGTSSGGQGNSNSGPDGPDD